MVEHRPVNWLAGMSYVSFAAMAATQLHQLASQNRT